LILYGIARHVPVSTYLVLSMLAFGPLLVTWAWRGERQGRAAHSLAITVFAVCALWAGSLYANGLGLSAAQSFTNTLATKAQVAVYSVKPLGLSGPGIGEEKFPASFQYRYRYTGLRLLYMDSGTYYLVPVGWSTAYSDTFVLDPSVQDLRLDLY
jgi:hypothetical protein